MKKQVFSNFALLGFALVALACSPTAEAPSSETSKSDGADLILTNAKVYTFSWGDPAADGTPAADAPFNEGVWTPDAEALAVRDGRVVLAGTAAEAEALRGEATEVIDLQGAVVLPGMVDSHTHVIGLGAKVERVDLLDVPTEEEAVERAAARAAETPAGEWVDGWGWDEGAWATRYPTMELISEKVPDHPVVLRSLHGFAVWGNRLAFEKAGIDRDTEAPVGGEILKDANGEPTGVLLNRATTLLTGAVPEVTGEGLQRRALAGLEEMARSGYVAVHEAGLDTSLLGAFEALNDAGRLPVRVYAMLSARDEALCRKWLENGPETVWSGQLIRRSVKAYYDGALGSRGARLLDDYSDTPGHRGVSGEGYGFDQELVADMIRGGFQVGIHAIGDAGNRETLDFLSEVLAEDPSYKDWRHRIEHAQVVHPDDFARFGEMGLVASMQPPHAVEDKTWAEERLGPDRVRGAYAWRTLLQSGARVVFNSDLAGSDHDLFYGLHAAMTRRGKDQLPEGGWYPGEALTPEEAIRAYSVWAAYASFDEKETGVLAEGFRADVTVLDIDPLNMADPGAILDGQVLLTMVGGNVVHNRVGNREGL